MEENTVPASPGEPPPQELCRPCLGRGRINVTNQRANLAETLALGGHYGQENCGMAGT